MLKLEFTHDTAEGLNAQVVDYLANIKKTRGGKASAADGEGAQAGGQAPAPMMPPTGNPPPLPGAGPVFAPPGAAAAAPAAFPAAAAPAPGPAPEVQALVQRISGKIDGAVQSGQPTDAVLGWFRNQCGPDAAQATLDQIKQVFLYRLPVPQLTEIAKLMNA